jgi:dTDP-4-dehydrorhamnose 3,5-epimerase
VDVTDGPLPGMRIVRPRVFKDARGWFRETYSAARYAAAGIVLPFVQDNLSWSAHGVLRGLHLQSPHEQGKLVSVLRGEVFDVAVDLRVGSPSFGKSAAVVLSEDNGTQVYLPPGLAHGFVVTSDHALFSYKCTADYHPEAEITLRWDDSALGISWPAVEISVSEKDRDGFLLRDIPPHRLPVYAE